MAALTINDVIVIDERNSLNLNVYEKKDGSTTYSLNAVNNGENETFYLRWAFPSEWKNGAGAPMEKSFPEKVLLGTSLEQAIGTLEALLAKLKGGQRPELPDNSARFPMDEPITVPEDEQIPF